MLVAVLNVKLGVLVQANLELVVGLLMVTLVGPQETVGTVKIASGLFKIVIFLVVSCIHPSMLVTLNLIG